MFGSFPSIVAAIALAIAAPLAHAQNGVCGGQLTNQGAYFSFTQNQDFTVLTVINSNGSANITESYVLYCNVRPDASAVGVVEPKYFQIPLSKVMVNDNYASTYIELAGQRGAISFLSNPQDIISPCLQKGVEDKTITPMLGDMTQYSLVNASFSAIQNPYQEKDIWMPHTVDIEPLARAEYTRAVSLFFNQGQKGQLVFDQIEAAYSTHKHNMESVPDAYKRRIGWIKYDFGAEHWTLRNSKFTTAIIRDAGGIPFPLSGGSTIDNLQLTTDEVKLIILNSNILIDQTEYPTGKSGLTFIRQTAGFTAAEEIPVISNSKIYSLDYTRNDAGSSDYNYRVASRPDLLLKDMIRAQYPAYSPYIGNFTFFNVKYGNGGPDGYKFNATYCGAPPPSWINNAPYDDDPILTIPAAPFLDYSPAPAAPTGGGIYGSYDGTPSGGGESKKSNVGMIVGVIVAAVVMAAGFAFAFFKWGKRAKEDRFIELEEEMNNEIPLH